MAVTQNTYTGNGSTTNYSFTFPYLETTDIKVSVNGVDTTAYTLASPTTISFNTAPANGASIRIYRDTDDSALSATFYPGSAIRAQDLNDNFTQNLYAVQEVNDNAFQTDGSSTMVGNLNMGGYDVINLATQTALGYSRWRKVATAGQTTFSGTGDSGGVLAYLPLREQVFINGVLQQRDADYSASNGTSITFGVGLVVGDVVEVVCINSIKEGSLDNASEITYGGQFAGQSSRTVAAKLADVVSVKDFGAVGDGVADDSNAIEAAAAASSSLYFPPGTYRVTRTISLQSKAIEALGAAVSGDTEDIVLILGGNSASPNNPVQNIGTVTRVSGTTTNPVVRIMGAKNQWITVKRCTYIQVYADSNSATTDSTAYSSFWFNYVNTLELNTNPSPSGSTVQWINENVFNLNRIGTLVVSGTYQHNSNKFLNGSFEAGAITFNVGSDNRVEGVRGEGGVAVTFAATTTKNVVLATWQSSGLDFIFPGTITDNGVGNYAGHQRWIDTKLTTLVAFNYSNLRMLPDARYNVSGVSGVAVGSSSYTVAAGAVFYDSGIIPCTGASLALFSNLIGRNSGGYRVRVDGYDASKVLITGASGDWNARGVGQVAFGGEAPTTSDGAEYLAAWIQNPNTRYIRIQVRASSNGINAEGFVLSVRCNSDEQVLAASGTMATPVSGLTKSFELTDNVSSNVFTFAIPTISGATSGVSFGFEVSYVIRCSRDSSTRSWRATYGKVYGAISRGWESDSNAAPVFTITTTDQSLATTNTAPTITWSATLDSGTDNGAKNGYLAVTVDNPIAATNRTGISATISWIGHGSTVGVS